MSSVPRVEPTRIGRYSPHPGTLEADAATGAEGVGRAVNQAVVISFLGIFSFNYVFTQTLLATHPEISVIK